MYHSARALVFFKGFRERSHYCLVVALQELFVDKGTLNADLVESFRNSMRLRESADYRSDFSEEGALLVVERAGQFLIKAARIRDLK